MYAFRANRSLWKKRMSRQTDGSRIPKMIDKDLLDILVCPACKTALTVKDEALKCGKCKRLYPVHDNIPIMLIDRATVDPN